MILNVIERKNEDNINYLGINLTNKYYIKEVVGLLLIYNT